MVPGRRRQLSGGEKDKAALARLAADGVQFALVMDEPTNHLDIWSCEALETVDPGFEGTVIVVSHDRYFLNHVVDRLIVLAGRRSRVIDGDYETYERLCIGKGRRSALKATVAPAPPARRQGEGRATRRGSFRTASRRSRSGHRRREATSRQIGTALASARTVATRNGHKLSEITSDRGTKTTARPALRALGRGS